MSASADETVQRFIASLGDACLVVSAKGEVVTANALAESLYGRSPGALAGTSITDLCPGSERDAVMAEIASCNGRPRNFRAVQLDASGTSFVADFSAKACHDIAADCVVLIVRRSASTELSCEVDLTLRTLMLNHVTDGIVCHTLEGDLIFANRAALATWGCGSLAEARRLGRYGWVADGQRQGVSVTIERLLTEGEARFESHGLAPSGQTVHLEIHSTLVENDGMKMVLSSVRDITDRVEAEEAMRYLAYHDMLTGLANRVMLENELASALSHADRHGDRVGVVFLDLNDFKPVNDTYGHAIGDHVLREVADRLAGAVRQTDTVARPGGDEFVVLLPRLKDPEDLSRVASALASEIEKPIVVGSITISVSASVGIALHVPGEDAETLLTRADLAMYASREQGVPGWELFG